MEASELRKRWFYLAIHSLENLKWLFPLTDCIRHKVISYDSPKAVSIRTRSSPAAAYLTTHKLG
jgi:hypothetical protein